MTGDAAWPVDPYSVDSISAAMQDVLSKDALRQEKIQRGLQRARGYTWQECARLTLEAYRKVLGRD